MLFSLDAIEETDNNDRPLAIYLSIPESGEGKT
jgi:hypothetical protein